MKSEYVTHNFAPIFDQNSQILMLGTMPSPKSRETGFYYGHPRNRIAIWDVLAGCEITGADDSSIRNPIPNDMNVILERANIKAIFATGTKAAQLYRRHCQPKTGIEVICLPSTSPANCRIRYEQLYEAYSQICKYL